MKHTMEKTPKVLTIIGLVLEFLGASIAALFYVLFDRLTDPDFLLKIDPQTTQQELDLLAQFEGVIKVVVLVSLIVGFTMFIINLYFFSGLMSGRYEEEKARKVYLYQFIYGIVCLFGNTIVGILYLLSGNQGRTGAVDRPYTREGI